MAETVAGRATPTARTEGAVLLVDADPNVAELLTTTLVVQGFQVYTAADGPAAVERARAVRPDAVILEVTLPGVEDFELLGRLRVEALARKENSAARVREAGAAPVVGALSDLEVLRSAASRSDAVIHLAQADSGEADLAAATAMLDGVGAGVYVHTGGTWVYGNTNGVVDETAPWDPPLLVAWRRSVEEAVLGRADCGGHPVIVQPGLLYGGDNRLIEMFYAAPGRDAGYMSHIGDGSNHWALVHVEDVARLYVAALQARPGSVYAGVGGVNPTAKEVAVALSRAAGLGDGVKSMTMEDAAEQMGPVADAFALDQQLSSARAQSELDWTPRHLDPLAVLSHH